MTASELAHKAGKAVHDNSTAILAALGVTGTLSTAYLTAKATIKATRIVDAEESKAGVAGSRKQRVKERARAVWTLYIPPVVSGTITVVVIVAGQKIGAKKTAAAYSLLGVAERTFEEYAAKVVEQLGDKKELAIRDEIAQDRVRNHPPSMVIVEAGKVLCHEAYSGRYFNCDIETIKKAVNEINAQLNRAITATLSDLYYLLGLEGTTNSDYVGWDSDKLLDVHFTPVLHDGKPCLSFTFNYIKPI